MSGLSNYLENKFLDHLRGTTFTAPSALYVKMHIGDPGEDCTSSPAGETTRKAITFNAASGGSMSQSGTCSWTNVSTTETYSHFSIWDAVGPSGGNPLGKGALTASKAVSAGDNFDLSSVTWAMD